MLTDDRHNPHPHTRLHCHNLNLPLRSRTSHLPPDTRPARPRSTAGSRLKIREKVPGGYILAPQCGRGRDRIVSGEFGLGLDWAFLYIYIWKQLGEILIWRGHSRFKSLGKGANDYTTSRGGPGQQQQGGQSDILKHAKIGKFGEMVLGKSNVSFRCRTAPIIEIRAPLPPQKRFTPFHSFISHRIYIHTYIYFLSPSSSFL